MADEKTTADSSKVAATGAAPVSDEKAAATSDEYQQLTGQADKPATDSDPVMDSINAKLAEQEQDQDELEEPGWINKDYEEREQVEYVDTSGDDDQAEDPHGNKDSDEDEKSSTSTKSPAKKTAAK